MRLYFSAVVLTVAATVVIINACLLATSSNRAVPVQIVQLK